VSKVFIYTLTEEDSGDVKYVGQTDNLSSRLYGHLNGKMSEDNPKMKWINDVISRGKKVQINVIDECDHSESVELEKYWINHYKERGFLLTNSVDARPIRRISAEYIPDDRLSKIADDIGGVVNVLSAHKAIITRMLGNDGDSGIIGNISESLTHLVGMIDALSRGLVKHKNELEKIKSVLLANGINVDLYMNTGDGI